MGFCLTCLICLLSIWLFITRVVYQQHYMLDEIVMDVLILVHVCQRMGKRGYAKYLENMWNWLDLFTIWICILYWIIWAVAPAMGMVETTWLCIRYSLLGLRVLYSTKSTVHACRSRGTYVLLETENGLNGTEDIEETWAVAPLVQKPLDCLIWSSIKDIHADVYHHITDLPRTASLSFDAVHDGYSFRQLCHQAQRGAWSILWMTLSNDIVFGIVRSTPWTTRVLDADPFLRLVTVHHHVTVSPPAPASCVKRHLKKSEISITCGLVTLMLRDNLQTLVKSTPQTSREYFLHNVSLLTYQN